VAEYTRPATWDDLRVLARYLNAANARYAIIGGYAIAAHGYNRFSEDLDILVDPSPDNTPRWIEALSRLPDGAARELANDPEVFVREGNYAIRINDEITVDVMPSACGHGWSELSPFIVELPLEGDHIKILSLEGLLLTKEGMRDKDRADRAVLLRALGRSTGP
jgi:ABC-type glycerol-3-phosphate transport system substrate-binding protein